MKTLQHFWRDLPLASRIAAFASLLVVVSLLTVTVLTIEFERANFHSELESQAHLLVDTLADRMLDSLYKDEIDEIQDIANDLKERPELTRFKVYDRGGRLAVDSDTPDVPHPAKDPDPIDPVLFQLPPGEIHSEWTATELVVTESLYIEVYHVGLVQMRFSTAPLAVRISALTVRSLNLAAGVLAIGILLSLLMARQLANPILEITRTAQSMAGGDLGNRFNSQGRGEIDQLGRAFNEMADAIEKRQTDLRTQAQSLERAVAQRTHELQQQNQYLAALHDVTLGLIQNLDVDRLLEAITIRAAALANTEHAFVSVLDAGRGELQLRVGRGNFQSHLGMRTKSDQGLVGRVVESGEMKVEPDYQAFAGRMEGFEWQRTSIYVPLKSEDTTLGVIGLGYDQIVPVEPGDVETLKQFAVLASLALQNAQLYDDAQQELVERKRIEELMKQYEDRLEVMVEERTRELLEANHRLQQEIAERERTQKALQAREEEAQAHRNSPQGRAEAERDRLLQNQPQALLVLHELGQQADTEMAAATLSRLPGVLQVAGHTMLAGLAEGYDFVRRSQVEPELLTVGMRQLLAGLGMREARSLSHTAEAAILYGACQRAIEAANVPAITRLLPDLQAVQSTPDSATPFAQLRGALRELVPVAQALHASERVDTTQDQHAYLVGAIERLTHAGRVAEGLGTVDRPIARRIVENWLSITSGSMSDVQTSARVGLQLVTRHFWEQDVVTLGLRVRNSGQGMALNVRVSAIECPEYNPLETQQIVERLGSGEEQPLELRVRPKPDLHTGTLRIRLLVLYDDPRGPDHTEHFADEVRLNGPAPAFQFIPNPYVAGTPLETGSPLFFGREDVFRFIEENLEAAHRNNLVLIGQRRTGKSSLLKQLPVRLPDEYVPVPLDGQSIALEPGLSAFFLNVATEITHALKDRGFYLAVPNARKFERQPGMYFKNEFLPRVRAAIGRRHLVLLLDEFEELEAAVNDGRLNASLFPFLRALIQHEPDLSVIFCGTHRLEELAADYWSTLFNISLHRHVGYLGFGEAERLIREPVEPYGMRYDDLVLDKMWRITAGHPYFLQLLCHSLVNHHNRSGRSYVTLEDLNAALDEILASGEAHFVYLWNESTLHEREVLIALSRMIMAGGHVTPVQVEDYLSERGLPLDRRLIQEALHHLALRDILAMQVDTLTAGVGGTYSWRLGLLGHWIEHYKSLSMLQAEAPT